VWYPSIFCTNYEDGEGKGILSWKEREAFKEDPLGTMRRNNASIIVCPVPVGALNPMDKRLQTNNPISLTGSLDPNSASAAGNQSATQVHIGDYAKDGKTLNAMQDIRDVYHGVSLDTTGFDNDTNASRISGHELSSKFAELFGFGDMNHPVRAALRRPP
tara:strand:+ start:60 stop:539 length:480 start_codon:yes stop_codon:yes gene_type:complete